jgi:16S rRNA A1518/A1519 N6-dimethyltransferase RsmA/KsgA/DIM1 with predicted DNA glycosylase/AP lyase activity
LVGQARIKSYFGPGSFYPAPKVASALVEVISHQQINTTVQEPLFQEFLVRLFTRKNRQVKAALRPLIKGSQNKQQTENLVIKDPLAYMRVKDVPPAQIIDLFQRIKILMQKAANS